MICDALKRLGFRSTEEVRRSLVPRKASRGRAGLGKQAIAAMYEDYKKLNSLAKAGKIYGRSRQAMFDIFRSHGLKLNARKFQERVRWNGEVFTPGKNGYLRGTRGDRRPLHKRIWESIHGPVPPGCQVTFKDGNKRNFDNSNLECLPFREVTLLHYRRIFPERANLTREERHQFWKGYYREYARKRSAAWVSRGLRSDGLARRGPPKTIRRQTKLLLSANERLALI